MGLNSEEFKVAKKTKRIKNVRGKWVANLYGYDPSLEHKIVVFSISGNNRKNLKEKYNKTISEFLGHNYLDAYDITATFNGVPFWVFIFEKDMNEKIIPSPETLFEKKFLLKPVIQMANEEQEIKTITEFLISVRNYSEVA
jgi:hypothetical protein